MGNKQIFEFNIISFLKDITKDIIPNNLTYVGFSYLNKRFTLKKSWGVTEFLPNGDIHILIEATLPIDRISEIYMHELAHAIVGLEAGHNQVWKDKFDELGVLYHKKFSEFLRTNGVVE